MKTILAADFQLLPGEPVREGILRIARKLAEGSRPDPKSGVEDLPQAVHVARLALKRSRALVRLLRPTLDPRACERPNARLRDAGRGLAEARDAAVGLELLDQIARKQRATETSGMAEVRRRFAEAIRDPEHSETHLRRGLAQAGAALQALSTALGRARWKEHGWTVVAAGLETGYRRARKRFRDAKKHRTPEAFHAWRTAAKSLLYQMELIRPAADGRTVRWLADLEALQSGLGKANDASTLLARLSKKPKGLGPEDAVAAIRSHLDSRLRRMHDDSLKLGRRLFADRAADRVDRLGKAWKAWRKAKAKAKAKAKSKARSNPEGRGPKKSKAPA